MRFHWFVALLLAVTSINGQSHEWTAISPHKHFNVFEEKLINNEFYCFEKQLGNSAILLKFNPEKLQLDTITTNVTADVVDYTILNNSLYYTITMPGHTAIFVRDLATGTDITFEISDESIRLETFDNKLLIWKTPYFPANGKEAHLISIEGGEIDTLYTLVSSESTFSSDINVTDDYIAIDMNKTLHFCNKSNYDWNSITLKTVIRDVAQVKKQLYILPSDLYIPIISEEGKLVDSIEFFAAEPIYTQGAFKLTNVDDVLYLSSEYWFMKSTDYGATWSPVLESKYQWNEYPYTSFLNHQGYLIWNVENQLRVFSHSDQELYFVNGNDMWNITQSYKMKDSILISFRTQLSEYLKVFKSMDFGITWESYYPEKLGKIGVYNLMPVDADMNDILYFNKGFKGELYQSSDLGYSWEIADTMENQWIGDYVLTTPTDGYYYEFNDTTYHKENLDSEYEIVEGVNNPELWKRYYYENGQTWIRLYDFEYNHQLYKVENGELKFESKIVLDEKYAEGIVLEDGYLILSEGKDIFVPKNGEEPYFYYAYDDEPILVAELDNFTLANKDGILHEYLDIQDPTTATPIIIDNCAVKVKKGDVFESNTGEVSIVSWNRVYYYGPPVDKSIFVSTDTEKDRSAFVLSLFPNPTTDEITIECEEDLDYYIYDFSGQVILSSRDKKINVSELSPRIYVLVAYNKQGQVRASKKFVKNE